MLIFVDETWQEVGGVKIGALGAVMIKSAGYNQFAKEVFAMKRRILGAEELSEKELKGKNCFSKNIFKRRADGRSTAWLDAAEKLLRTLKNFDARIAVVWTNNPDLLTLRQPDTVSLTKPYSELLTLGRAYMVREAKSKLASLNFDQRAVKEDSATACAITNYIYRAAPLFQETFTAVPNFTVSAASPGLQAADLVAYLGAFYSDRTARPELDPYLDQLTAMRYEWRRSNGKKRHTVRCVARVP